MLKKSPALRIQREGLQRLAILAPAGQLGRLAPVARRRGANSLRASRKARLRGADGHYSIVQRQRQLDLLRLQTLPIQAVRADNDVSLDGRQPGGQQYARAQQARRALGIVSR